MAKTEYMLHREVEHVLSALTMANRLVCQVMLHTGLRVDDALSITAEQVRMSRFWVTEKKTGKRRIVGLPEPLRRDIIMHCCPNPDRTPWAFPGVDPAKHRTRQAVWKDVKRAARLFRLEQNVAPHSFRKVYAVDLLDRSGDIDKVKRALNHGNYEVTMVYAMADKLLQAKKGQKAAYVGRRL